MTETEQTRCGFAAIIGAPNAGKSTLINQLTGAKVSIVTHKVQTTRARIRAITLVDETQIVFVDTPGIFAPKRKFDEAMVEAAWEGASQADSVILIIDCRHGLDADNEAIINSMASLGKKAVLVLNKIDLIANEKLLELAGTLNERGNFEATFMISALKGSGVKDLKKYIANEMPPGPWLYPDDQLADMPMRLLAAEITREKVFLQLHDELPYASTVETESWKERRNDSVRVEQVIYVERESQRKIMLGKNGQTIKKIGQMARIDMAEAVGKTVHLFLFVKVRPNWSRDNERLRMMGLEPKSK